MTKRLIITLFVLTANLIVPSLAGAASDVGVAGAVNTNAYGTPPSQSRRVISLGDSIFFNEHIVTDENGLVQILLKDGSTFTVSPSCELVIDKFVYNPETEIGEIVATLFKGTMRFIGGKISKTENSVTINTAAATIGVRGGIVLLSEPEGEGEAEYSFHYGEAMEVAIRNGQSIRITKPGQSVRLTITSARAVRSIRRGKASLGHISKMSTLKGDRKQAGGKKSANKAVGQIARRLKSSTVSSVAKSTTNAINKLGIRTGNASKMGRSRKHRRMRRHHRKF